MSGRGNRQGTIMVKKANDENNGGKMKKLFSLLVVIGVAAAAFAQQAEMKTFHANDDKKRDVISFTSKAPLETIVGTTADVLGYVTVDPNNVLAGAKARFEVDLASLKTGISLRDQHMREQYLETDKYSKTTFELTRVVSSDNPQLLDGKATHLVLEGNFTVHGVTKLIQIPATVTYMKESEVTKTRLPGDLLHIEATFTIMLGDYSIKRPQFVILKLDEAQKINIDIFAATGLPPVDFKGN